MLVMILVTSYTYTRELEKITLDKANIYGCLHAASTLRSYWKKKKRSSA